MPTLHRAVAASAAALLLLVAPLPFSGGAGAQTPLDLLPDGSAEPSTLSSDSGSPALPLEDPAPSATADAADADPTLLAVAFIIDAIDGLSAVNATVSHGVLHLTGESNDPDAVTRLVELVPSVHGVDAVLNDIEVVAPDVSGAVAPLWRESRALAGRLVSWLPLAVVALLLFAFFAVVSRFVRGWDAPFDRLTRSPMGRTVAQQGVALLLLVIGLVAALQVMKAGAVIGAVLGTAGVFGLAVGFALQDLVQNYIAGMLLGIRRPFALGDVIEVAGHTGKVSRLTMRETELLTFDGNHVRIPNASVFQSSLTNFTRNPKRRFDFVVGVGPGEPLVPALELAVDVLGATKGVLLEPKPTANVESLADWTVNLHCYAWVDQTRSGFLSTKSRGIRRVKEAFDAAGIDMPNPTYVLQQPDLRAAANAPEELKAAKMSQAREVFIEQTDDSVSRAEDQTPADPIDGTIREDRANSEGDLLS